MEPKEEKKIRLILKAQQTTDDNIIYSVKFSARDIAILCWLHEFQLSASSRHKTAILKEIATAANSLSHYSFIIVTKEDSPKEEIDFMNEVYNALVNHGNDVLFEEC